MTRRLFNSILLAAAFAALVMSATETWAKKPGGGGGGSTGPSYTIIDLPGPYDFLQSQTHAHRISNVSGNRSIYVLGRYNHNQRDDYQVFPCVWTIQDNGTVDFEDLNGLIERGFDINSEGIIAGDMDGRPAILLPNGETIYLADEASIGLVWGLNNVDQLGVFQAVGYVVSPATGPERVIWDLTDDGIVVATTPLIDPNGQELVPYDINDQGQIAGVVTVDGVPTPAVGAFDVDGLLQISPRSNPNPAEIDGFGNCQIDDAGNLLGQGVQPIDGSSAVYLRAVICPVDVGSIDLSAESGFTSTEAGGIALVGGVMQVVGRATKGDGIAFLYTNGTLRDLGPLSKGDQNWILDNANGINNEGIICGVGKVGSRRNQLTHGFLLIPNSN